jgi:hypothetical protein
MLNLTNRAHVLSVIFTDKGWDINEYSSHTLAEDIDQTILTFCRQQYYIC